MQRMIGLEDTSLENIKRFILTATDVVANLVGMLVQGQPGCKLEPYADKAPEVDPRIAQLTAMGYTSDQVRVFLGMLDSATVAAPIVGKGIPRPSVADMAVFGTNPATGQPFEPSPVSVVGPDGKNTSAPEHACYADGSAKRGWKFRDTAIDLGTRNFGDMWYWLWNDDRGVVRTWKHRDVRANRDAQPGATYADGTPRVTSWYVAKFDRAMILGGPSDGGSKVVMETAPAPAPVKRERKPRQQATVSAAPTPEPTPAAKVEAERIKAVPPAPVSGITTHEVAMIDACLRKLATAEYTADERTRAAYGAMTCAKLPADIRTACARALKVSNTDVGSMVRAVGKAIADAAMARFGN